MMQIVIKENGRPMVIRLPNFLLITSLGKNLLKNKYNVNLNRNQLKQTVKALNQFKKQSSLPLVEVISEDSEVIVQW